MAGERLQLPRPNVTTYSLSCEYARARRTIEHYNGAEDVTPKIAEKVQRAVDIIGSVVDRADRAGIDFNKVIKFADIRSGKRTAKRA
jgi:hypothetical protein